MIHWRLPTFLAFISYSFKTPKPAVMRDWYLLYKRRKSPSVHTFLFFLLIPLLIAFDRMIICFSFFNHNSFSAVLLFYCKFYTLVHRKHCRILTILFLPVIIHSRGLCECLWWQGMNCESARRPWEWGEGEEKKCGMGEMETETMTEGIITWGDKCMRRL